MIISMDNLSLKHRKTALDIVFKILLLIIGIVSTLFLISIHVIPYIQQITMRLSFSFPTIPKFSRLSTAYLLIIIHFIIMIIWKLNRDQVSDHDMYFTHEHMSEESEHVSEPHFTNLVSKSSFDRVLISQEISEPVIEIHTVQSVEKNFEISQEESEPTVEIHTVKSVDNNNIEQWLTPLITESGEDTNYVEEDEYPDSLDATWHAIVKKRLEEGDNWETVNHGIQATLNRQAVLSRAVPVPAVPTHNPELKKSDTFREPKVTRVADDDLVKKEMRKSNTFSESMNSPVGWKGRNVWVERDEMFRNKVEAFIKMNYDQMRLQRKESRDRHRVEMANAAY